MSVERVSCAPRLELTALPGLPTIEPGDDLGAIILEALERAGLALEDGDVVVVCSNVVARAEGRFVALSEVVPGEEARALAARVGKEPELVELVLRESTSVSRAAPGALVVRHRLGLISANAGIDRSNAGGEGGEDGGRVLLLPEAPDDSAERLRVVLASRGARVGVVVSDSLGRPFRLGTVGAAIGVAGLPALSDERGRADRFGRTLEHSVVAVADAVAAAADLVAGQAAEGRPVVVVRGLAFPVVRSSARALCRPPDEDLYA